MSFFVGNVNGDAILHITKNYKSRSQMMGGVLGDTYIHPSINYTGYRLFRPGNIYKSYNSSRGLYEYKCYFSDTATSSFRSYVLNSSTGDRNVFVAVVDGDVAGLQTSDTGLPVSSAGPIIYEGSDGYLDRLLRPDTVAMGFVSNKGYGDVFLLVFDVDVVGRDNIKEFSFGKSSVAISKTQFNIGGTEITDIPFLCYGDVVNSTDLIVRLNNTRLIQLVNSVPVSGDFQLNTDNNKTVIKKGTKTIVDTTKNLAMSSSHSVTTLKTPQIEVRNYGSGYSRYLGSLPGNGLYIVSWSRYYQGTTIVFCNGTIISVDTSVSTDHIRVYSASLHLRVEPSNMGVTMYADEGWDTTYPSSVYYACFTRIA